MTHPLPGRSCSPSNISHDRFLITSILDVSRGILFGRPSNLSNQNYRLCRVVLPEQLENVDKVKPSKRIPAYSQASGLPYAGVRQRLRYLIGQSAAARCQADIAL